MNAERDTTRSVRSWLENGVNDLPDRVLDPVLDRLPTTPQRRHRWQTRRFTKMTSTLKIGIAAAAVVVVGVAGLALRPGSTAPSVAAAPTAAPTATATATTTVAPSASPIPSLPPSGVLEPGRYRIKNVSIQVPAGWTASSTDLISKDYGASAEDAGALFAVWPITGTFVDPCSNHTLVQPAPSAGIDALADALASQPGTEAAQPTSVTIDGHPAKLVEVTVTADIHACPPYPEGFWLWAMPGGDRRYVQGSDELNKIYVVEVDGERLTFEGRIPAMTTAADRAELEGIIASINVEP